MSRGEAMLPERYDELVRTLTERIRTAQVRAALAVNRELVCLYWEIGHQILLRQQEQGWGSRVIDRLAADLRREFPDIKGFSPRNLKYMRAFAEAYPDEPFVQQVVAQIPWGLRCFVIVDLKTGEFRPEYVGKMNFYLAATDDLLRHSDDQPSIGIILCGSANSIIVEYALRESNKPIGVASYRLVSKLPRELEGELPAPEQVAKLLAGVGG